MKTDRHRLLARQLRRHFPDGMPEGMEKFVEEVNAFYHETDQNQKLMERAMGKSSEELFHRNRTLREEMERLDGFIYRVSHDLKAPANNVLSMVELLESQLPEDSTMARMMADHIRKGAQGLLKQLRDLLELSRMKSQLNEAPESVDLKGMAGEVWEALSQQVKQTEAVLEMDFSACPTLELGRENLRSILQNLIGNGLKYHLPGRPPRITVTSASVDDYVALTIADNGMGIDLDKHRAKLFGMFNRFHNHVEGSGVGLYIVKQIVEAHGGQIEVTSQVGEGTTFVIRLLRSPKAVPVASAL